jgi:arsenite methyltransferase
MSATVDVEAAVWERYSRAAQSRDDALCCPVTYDPKFMNIIPDEIKEADYGCGDPSRFVHEGEVVLDLGSGAGKICYIVAQIVGPGGRVIGVDQNDEMLALARKYQQVVAERMGYHNIDFRKGRIQDLRLDLTLVDSYLSKNPITSVSDLRRFHEYCDAIKAHSPLVANESVDLVVSNCVLNLVRHEDKEQLFEEMYRVVRRGGHVAISDIVSDEDVPAEIKRDPELWSGCIAGAYREDAFLNAFDRAGFYGMEIVKRDEKPWRTVQGIEFRSITLVAHKGKQGPCWERNQAVIYRGPWRKVVDDDGHVLERGKRMAVCDKTFQVYSREPYAADIFAIEPYQPIPLGEATVFDCHRSTVRDSRETKGLDYEVTDLSGKDCRDSSINCC